MDTSFTVADTVAMTRDINGNGNGTNDWMNNPKQNL